MPRPAMATEAWPALAPEAVGGAEGAAAAERAERLAAAEPVNYRRAFTSREEFDTYQRDEEEFELADGAAPGAPAGAAAVAEADAPAAGE